MLKLKFERGRGRREFAGKVGGASGSRRCAARRGALIVFPGRKTGAVRGATSWHGRVYPGNIYRVHRIIIKYAVYVSRDWRRRLRSIDPSRRERWTKSRWMNRERRGGEGKGKDAD